MVTIDRRILKSQEAIKSALVKLMSQKEFDKITVKDICIEANVGNRTFYLHYLDKYDLLDKLVEGHMEELKRLCEPVSDNNYKAAHMIWFEYLKTHYLFFQLCYQGKALLLLESTF
ncbi:TetR/AcrR family transcriptional regulator [Staphylococcus equorum]